MSIGIAIWSIGNDKMNDSMEENVDEDGNSRKSRYSYYDNYDDGIWNNFVRRLRHEVNKVKKAWNKKK